MIGVDDRLLTFSEVTRILRLKDTKQNRYVVRQVERGNLRAIELGRNNRRISAIDLARFLESRVMREKLKLGRKAKL